jgi:FtsP/CotA-like multicopper oxidase with cupredoxin domain
MPRRVGHNQPKLLLAPQERLEETPDPREGQEPFTVHQLREANGHMAMEFRKVCLEVGLPAGRQHVHPKLQQAATVGDWGVGR